MGSNTIPAPTLIALKKQRQEEVQMFGDRLSHLHKLMLSAEEMADISDVNAV